MQVLFILIAGLIALILISMMAALILVPLFRGIGWCISHVFAFVGGEIGDLLRFIGAIITTVIFSFLVVGNILIFRWSASAHFGRAVQAELAAAALSIYRIFIGHPARFLCLNSLVDGLENRVPQAVAAAPTKDKPSRRAGVFEHYKIIGSLKGGGSGGKLYIAEPDDIKLASFVRNGWSDVGQVVIKSFSLKDGSSLPQIVRESRSLDAAKKLGLVLDHELTSERFYYVMPYVPGESLGMVTTHLHAASPPDGLTNANLAKVLGYVEHLSATLEKYHRGGLWHKDVKPDNIIIHGSEAHLVDFGLITPLRSAMTLTTHGTEYFRDPEMVRMALKGVKVHEVDGARFDIYAAGAVLYSAIENEFPAHGGLSQITKRCPDAVRWIIRRAMADYDKRYTSAAAMLADLQYVSRSVDPFAVKPAQLPSFSGHAVPEKPAVEVDSKEFAFSSDAAAAKEKVRTVVQTAATIGKAVASAATARVSVASSSARVKPKIRVSNWWSGQYNLVDAPQPASSKVAKRAVASDEQAMDSKAFLSSIGAMGVGAGGVGAAAMPRRSAAEQLQAARDRAHARRERAMARQGRRLRDHRQARRYASGVNLGVAAAIFVFLSMCLFLAAGVMFLSPSHNTMTSQGNMAQTEAPKPDNANFVVNDQNTSSSSTLASAQSGTGNNTAHADSTTTPPPPAPPAPLPALSGSVLVVNDLLPPYDSRVESMLRSGLSAMQQAGLKVLGTFPGLSLDDESSKKAIELAAEARKTRAQSPIESRQTNDTLTHWLDANKEADVLVWIVPGINQGDKPRVFVFASSEARNNAPNGYIPMIQQLLSLPG